MQEDHLKLTETVNINVTVTLNHSQFERILMSLNEAQKLNAICKALGIDPTTGATITPTLTATVDPTALQAGIDAALTANASVKAVVAGVADIQAQVDEPTPAVTSHLATVATA